MTEIPHYHILFSRRMEIAKLAEKWCEDASAKLVNVVVSPHNPFNIISALDALGFLKENKDEQQDT